MRAAGQDIVELFGYAPDDLSASAVKFTRDKQCPFSKTQCSKTNHNQSEIYGTCSVSTGSNKLPGSETIVCPTRLYANQYASFSDVVADAWKQHKPTLVAGGTLENLRKEAMKHNESVVAFGQNSGAELQVDSFGKMSLDWVLQRYQLKSDKSLKPVDFVGIEVQSIDTTGNYRDNQTFYVDARLNNRLKNSLPPNSRHGLNWANVHKRLIPQIIRKGNIYSQMQ